MPTPQTPARSQFIPPVESGLPTPQTPARSHSIQKRKRKRCPEVDDSVLYERLEAIVLDREERRGERGQGTTSGTTEAGQRRETGETAC